MIGKTLIQHQKGNTLIRGRQLGGRLHTYMAEFLQRMSDYDFKAASYDGYGQDWPIVARNWLPGYTHIEEFLGLWYRRKYP